MKYDDACSLCVGHQRSLFEGGVSVKQQCGPANAIDLIRAVTVSTEQCTIIACEKLIDVLSSERLAYIYQYLSQYTVIDFEFSIM